MQMEFEKATFWVWMYNLPLACMGMDIRFKIGSLVGIVKEVDKSEHGVGWREYLHVKIILDMKKPFSQSRMLQLKGQTMWIAFQYEKIPKFGFRSGTACHGAMECQGRPIATNRRTSKPKGGVGESIWIVVESHISQSTVWSWKGMAGRRPTY